MKKYGMYNHNNFKASELCKNAYRGCGFDGNRTLRMISDIDVLQLFLLTRSVGLTGVGFDVPCTIRVLQGHAVTT